MGDFLPLSFEKKRVASCEKTRLVGLILTLITWIQRAEVVRVLSTPFVMLFREPIVFFVSLYTALVYGLS